MNSVAIKGSLVAIVTPMHENGELDLERFSALIDYHVAEGTDGIVVVGTTGESPTVDFEEHNLLIRTAVERAAGRIPVIAGTGANSTREAIDLSIFARDAGADASLSVVPYYNKPTQEGLYQHFRAVAEAVDIPPDSIQRAWQDGGRYRQRNGAEAGRDPQYCRHQGCDRRHGARFRATEPRAAGLCRL